MSVLPVALGFVRAVDQDDTATLTNSLAVFYIVSVFKHLPNKHRAELLPQTVDKNKCSLEELCTGLDGRVTIIKGRKHAAAGEWTNWK